MVPIFVNYDMTEVIGVLTYEYDHLIIKFALDSHITNDILLRTIDCNFVILDNYCGDDGIKYLSKIKILSIHCRGR